MRVIKLLVLFLSFLATEGNLKMYGVDLLTFSIDFRPIVTIKIITRKFPTHKAVSTRVT